MGLENVQVTMSFVFLALSDSDLKDKQRTCEASQLLLSQEELYTQGKKKSAEEQQC